MKVLQINAVYGYGSTGLITQDIDKLLIENGIDSFIAYAQCNESPKNGYKIGCKIDYKIHAIMTRILGKQGYFSINSTKKFINYMDRIKPDIVHLHNLHNNYINLNYLLKYLKKNNITTVITMHDCWYFTGKCFHFEIEKCYKWKNKCNKCPRNKKDIKSLFFDRTMQVFQDKKKHLNNIENLIIVGVSDWMCNQINQSFLQEKKSYRIYNGVDIDIFKPTASNLKEQYNIKDKFIILGMANKWLQDNNKEALQKISNNISKDCIIILIGCTESQKLNLPNNVLGIGYINNRYDLAEYYSISDVFVNLTWEDSLPTVNMESISCGTPVITYNSGGSPELITKDTGMIVEQGDITSVLKAINEIKNNGKILYKQSCRNYAEKYFNKHTNYKEYLNLYKSIINNP